MSTILVSGCSDCNSMWLILRISGANVNLIVGMEKKKDVDSNSCIIHIIYKTRYSYFWGIILTNNESSKTSI